MSTPFRRVGIIAPMPSEMRAVVKAMALRPRGRELHGGRVGAVEVLALQSGMGMSLAADASRRLLDAEPVDHVIVVGIAGGVGPARVGEVVCPLHVLDGTTALRFEASPLTGSAAGSISSSDDFVIDSDRVAALVANGVRAVDMETAAIAAVCVERGCGWSAVRVVSDLASDHPDAAVLGLANPDGSPNARAAARFMLANPGRIPQLMKLGRDAARAARAAAAEAAHQLLALPVA